jgi:hypothetical protein
MSATTAIESTDATWNPVTWWVVPQQVAHATSTCRSGSWLCWEVLQQESREPSAELQPAARLVRIGQPGCEPLGCRVSQMPCSILPPSNSGSGIPLTAGALPSLS